MQQHKVVPNARDGPHRIIGAPKTEKETPYQYVQNAESSREQGVPMALLEQTAPPLGRWPPRNVQLVQDCQHHHQIQHLLGHIKFQRQFRGLRLEDLEWHDVFRDHAADLEVRRGVLLS